MGQKVSAFSIQIAKNLAVSHHLSTGPSVTLFSETRLKEESVGIGLQ